MDRDRYQQLKRIFLDVLELTGKDRDAFLEQACRGDEEVRRYVSELLSEHEALRRADREHKES